MSNRTLFIYCTLLLFLHFLFEETLLNRGTGTFFRTEILSRRKYGKKTIFESFSYVNKLNIRRRVRFCLLCFTLFFSICFYFYHMTSFYFISFRYIMLYFIVFYLSSCVCEYALSTVQYNIVQYSIV